MTRFRPAVESLDARALPSAVVPNVPDAPSAMAAEVSHQPASGQEAALSINFTKIKFNTLAIGKVSFQDFHFTQKMDKASTGL